MMQKISDMLATPVRKPRITWTQRRARIAVKATYSVILVMFTLTSVFFGWPLALPNLPAEEAQAAVEATGTPGSINSNVNASSQSITVPADATLLVVGASGWDDSNGYFTTTALTIGGQSMTRQVTTGSTSGTYTGIYYKVSPPTGSQTLAWDWNSTPAPDEGMTLFYSFYKGIDTTTPIRDSDSAPSMTTQSVTTPTLTASNGDLTVTVAGGNGTNTIVWTNVNKIGSDANYNTNHGSHAYAIFTGNATVGVDMGSGGNYAAISAVVFRAAANAAPTIASTGCTGPAAFSATASTAVGSNVTFCVDWNDADSGELVKAHACKTNVINASASGGNCDTSQTWASSSSASNTPDPRSETYTALAADVGTKTYYVFVCDDGSSCSGTTGNSGTFAVTNTAPALGAAGCNSNAFSDSPDPVANGASLTLCADWTDANADSVKVHFCKANNAAVPSASGGACGAGGSWADSTSVTTTDPKSETYTAQAADIGTSPNTYYAFVCDNNAVDPKCSGTTSNSGTFSVSSSGPSVTTDAASSITATSATLNGTANPNAQSTTGYFYYKAGSTFTCDAGGVGSATRHPSADGDALGNGTSGVAYNEPLSGLTDGVRYYFCAVANNTSGTQYGTVLSFIASNNAIPSIASVVDSPATATAAARHISFPNTYTANTNITAANGAISLTDAAAADGGTIDSVTYDMRSANGAAFQSALWKGTKPAGSEAYMWVASSNCPNGESNPPACDSAVGGSAVARTGSVVRIDSTLNASSQAVTVPADADAIVVGVSGAEPGTNNYFGNGSVSIGGNNLTLVAQNGNEADNAAQTAVWVLTGPPTGSQTFAWDWAGTSAVDYGGSIFVAYYKNVHQSTPVRDSGTGVNPWPSPGGDTASTGSMTALSGDGIVAVSGADANSINWTNATEVLDGVANTMTASFAETFPSTDTNVSATAIGGDANSISVVGVVLLSAGGGSGWEYRGSNCAIDGPGYEPNADTSVEIGCESDHYNKRYFRYRVQICGATDCAAGGSGSATVADVTPSTFHAGGGFPAVQGAVTSVDNSGTAKTVNLPSSIQANDLILIIAGDGDGSGMSYTAPMGYTEIGEYDIANDAGVMVAYRYADGTEGSTVTWTASDLSSVWAAYRISGAENPATQAPQVTSATGTSSTPNPPSISPTGGAKNYLFIAAGAMENSSAVNSIPTNYSNEQDQTTGSSIATLGAAERQLNASSENPGTFSFNSTDNWSAVTIAIHPTSGGAADNNHLVQMPATVNANDLLVTFFSNAGSSTVTDPDGAGAWTELASTANGSNNRFTVYYKVAAGTEGGTTVDFVTSANQEAVAQVYRVNNWHGTTVPEISTAATGSGANPDPGSLNPSNWDSESTLWLAAYGSSQGQTASAPASYTNGTQTGTDTGKPSMASARRTNTTASEDAGAFTVAAAPWVAFTVGIRPPGSATSPTVEDISFIWTP